MVLVESFSGIRGIFGKEIDGDISRRYAYVFYEFLKNKLKKEPLIVIGQDTRFSSDTIREAMYDSLLNIINVGVSPTPAVEFAVRELKADGGIIVTASHNPPEYNGFKFLDSEGGILSAEDSKKLIDEFHKIKDLAEEDFLDNFMYKEKMPRIKKIKNIDIKKGYLDFLLGMIKKDIELIKNANLKIVLDPVGGTAIIAKELLEQIGVEVVGVNIKEGEFKRIIEPNGSSLSYLKKTIKKEKADFAAGFDLDGDRMAIMLEDGEVSGNYILAILVDDILSEIGGKDKIVVVNDATSNVVKEITEKHGAKIKEVEVGEINVVNEIYKSKSPIGGEGSCAGGIVPPSRCRDGMMSLLFILKSVAKKKKRLSEIVNALPVYYNLRKNIEFDAKKHDEIKKRLKEHYSKHKINELGGKDGSLKVIIDDHNYVWFRASKTEGSMFRIIVDSNKKEKAERLLEQAVKIFNKVK